MRPIVANEYQQYVPYGQTWRTSFPDRTCRADAWGATRVVDVFACQNYKQERRTENK